MRGKRIPPKEPVDGILSTKTRISVGDEDETTVLGFRCWRCRHMLPDLYRVDRGDDAGSLWVGADTEGPWWRWDGTILRPTRTHLTQRQRLQEHAAT